MLLKLLSFVITMLGHYGVVEMNYLSRILSPSSVDSSGDSGMGFLDRYNQLYRYGKIASLIYLITLPYVLSCSWSFNSLANSFQSVVKCAILAFYRKIVVSKKSLYFLYVVAFVIVGQGVGNFTVCCILRFLVFTFESLTYWIFGYRHHSWLALGARPSGISSRAILRIPWTLLTRS